MVLLGCQSQPPANLLFVDVAADRFHYDVIFDADTNFLEFYSKNPEQKVTSNLLICSMAAKPNFDVEGDDENPASGTIEYVGKASRDNKPVYRFKSHVIFYKTTPSGGQSMAKASEVYKSLPANNQMSCQVRLLVYLGPAYFSRTLFVPTDRIRSLSLKMAPEES